MATPAVGDSHYNAWPHKRVFMHTWTLGVFPIFVPNAAKAYHLLINTFSMLLLVTPLFLAPAPVAYLFSTTMHIMLST